MVGVRTTALCGACLFVACSSSSPAGSDAGDDGGSSNTLSCGNASITGQVRATDVISLGPITGATISAPGCSTTTTDDHGFVQIAADPNFLLKLSATAPGYVNAYAEITILKGGFAETGADYATSDAAAVIPQLSTSNGYLFVGVGGDGSDAGPCAAGTGASVSIDGHPELTPQYLKDQKTIDSSGTATEGFGTLFGPMPPGPYSISATKTGGCTSTGSNDGYFSYAPSTTVVANTVTLVSLKLTP